MAQDYYAILDVPRMATQEYIKRSYHRLMLLHHPDKNGGARSAKDKTQLVRGFADTRMPAAELRL